MVSVRGSDRTRQMGGARRAPLDGRGSGNEQGFAGWWSGITGGLSDLGRGFGNAITDAGDFIASRPATTKGGSQIFGPDKAPSKGRRGSGGTFGAPTPQERLQQQEQGAAQQLGLLDFLQQALDLGAGGAGGGGGVDYNPLREAARGRYSQGNARLEAMYRQLADSIAGQAGTIGSNYDSAGQGYNQNAQQAQSTINDAYQASRDAQSRQFQQLGIQDAAAVLAAQGGNAAADQANAVSGIEQNRAAVTNQNEAAKQAALAQNASHVSAAGLAGAEQRGRLQAELNQLLGEYDVAEQTQNAQLAARGGRDIGNALQVAQMLQEDYNSRLPQAPTFDQQLDLEKLAIERLKAMGSGRTLQDALNDVMQLQQYATSNNIPEDRFSEFAKLVLGAR